MSTSSQDPFPDLHQKMSKKIAQLTKVIYQLNTRNEDHQSEIDSITRSHQLETQRLMLDAASKIGKFKDLMDIRKVADALESRMEKLLKKHELEKQNALQDFDAYKIRANDTAQRTTRDYQVKLEVQADAIEKMNLEYQKTLSAFESCNKELSDSINNLKINGKLEVDEVRKRFNSEKVVNDHIMQKEQQEHLELIEMLRVEHERSLAEALKDMEEKMKAEAGQTLGLIRAQLTGDRQEALMALRRELDEKFKAQNDVLFDKIEKMRIELALKVRECETIAEEKNILLEKFNSQRDSDERQACDENDKRLAELGALKGEVFSLTENIKVLQQNRCESEESCRQLESLLNEKNEAGSHLQAMCATLQCDVELLRSELLRSTTTSMSAEKGLKERVAAGERESNGLRSEVNQMAANLSQLREDLRNSEKALQKSVADSVKSLSDAKGEIQKLQSLLEGANSSIENNGTRASGDIAAMGKRIHDIEAEAASGMRAAVEAHQCALHSLREKQNAALDAERIVLENFKAVSLLKETQLQAEISSVRSRGAESAQALLETHRRESAEMLVLHSVAMTNINDALEASNKQIAEMGLRMNAERGVMKADLSRLEQENSSLLSDLGAGTGDRLLLDGLVSSLKSQVETLREELVSIQKAHIEKMETSLSKLDRAWEDKMTSLRDSQSRNLENAFITCRKAHREEITELTAKFDRERKSLEHSLVRLSSSASDESKRAQSDLINTAEMLQAEKDSHALSVTMFNQQIKEDREVSEQRLEAELETLRAAAQAAAEERERLTCEGHEAVVVLMKAMYRKAIDDHSIALTASEAAAKLSAEEMTTEERRKASSDMSAKIKELQKEHREAETQLKNEHIGAVRSLVNEKEMLCRGMEVLQESIKSAEGVLKEAKEKSAKKEIQLVEKVEAMRRENILNIEEEQRRGDRSLSEAAERASCVEAEIKAAFREECLKYESQIEVSRSAFEALDIRWRKRESRPEDVRRIHLLEIDCAEKEEIVVKTREEMVYFKRELLNREENFNQKFGRSPVVGVMQVLRPKDSGLGGLSTMDAGSKPPKPSTSVGGFGGVRSSKPTYSVSNGGNNTGMEMSMGSSGLGSGSAPGSVSSSLSNTEVSLKAMGRRSFS